MDQLKTQLAVVFKHGFWISTVLVLLSTVGVWYMSTSALEKENDSQTSKINSAISTVSSVQGDLPQQPNDLSHTKMNALIEDRQSQLFAQFYAPLIE